MELEIDTDTGHTQVQHVKAQPRLLSLTLRSQKELGSSLTASPKTHSFLLYVLLPLPGFRWVTPFPQSRPVYPFPPPPTLPASKGSSIQTGNEFFPLLVLRVLTASLFSDPVTFHDSVWTPVTLATGCSAG